MRATPTVIGSPTSSRTRTRSRAAISAGVPAIRSMPRTSMNASSIESPSTTGDVSSKILNTALLAAVYASNRGGTTIAPGQSCLRRPPAHRGLDPERLRLVARGRHHAAAHDHRLAAAAAGCRAARPTRRTSRGPREGWFRPHHDTNICSHASLTESTSSAAVENGTVPHAVAITPRRRVHGRRRHPRQPVPDRVDDEADHDARCAAARRSRPRRPRRALRPGVRAAPGARGRRRLRPPKTPGDGAAAPHPHVRARLLLLERRSARLAPRARHRPRRDLRGAADRRPRHALRVRHQHRLARPRGRGGLRPAARRLPARRTS